MILLKIYPKDRLSHCAGFAEGFCGRFLRKVFRKVFTEGSCGRSLRNVIPEGTAYPRKGSAEGAAEVLRKGSAEGSVELLRKVLQKVLRMGPIALQSRSVTNFPGPSPIKPESTTQKNLV